MSSTTIPMMRAASEVRPAQSRAKEPASRTPAATVVGGDPGRVGQLAGEVGRHDPARADEAEEPDDGVGVVVRAPREQEGQRGPQHAEGGERAGPVPGPPAQHGLGDQQAQRRPDELGIAAVRACALGGERPPQHDREDDHEPGREPVDGPPPGGLGHQPRHGAGEKDAQQQPRHDAGHDAAPPFLGRQVGREGDHHLPGHRGAADEDGRHGEGPQVRRQRAADRVPPRSRQKRRVTSPRRGWRSPRGTTSSRPAA